MFHQALEFGPRGTCCLPGGRVWRDAALLPKSKPCCKRTRPREGFLPEQPKAGATVSIVTEKAGDRIGHYKLLEQIGEGGCGVVYMAEQVEPIRRRVALKVIKLGMDTKHVIARFEAERQALALMDQSQYRQGAGCRATETAGPTSSWSWCAASGSLTIAMRTACPPRSG